MSTMYYIAFAIPFFLLTMWLEYLYGKKRPERAGRGYVGKDTWASLAMGVGNVALSTAFKVVNVGMLVLLYEFRLFEIDNVWWAWVLLIVAEDFCYYWFHRVHHESRWFWAAHVNHHSSRHYNLSTALRQSWTTPFTGFLFWAPLPLLGFHPAMILGAKAISLLYQYWLHTELVGRLGPFEWVFNTPSHHRVHHGRNPQYLDRNYGGILIIWDRLFGTFELEQEEVDYGLTKNLTTFNPWKIAWHEWVAMLRASWAAPGLGNKLGYLLRAPGWRHDGTGTTAAQLREQALAGVPTTGPVACDDASSSVANYS